MFLPQNTFETVISSAPLVSIDLLIKNSANQYLLGFRKNKPAQGFWFVPGGRIQKNESLDKAFIRICNDELGVSLTRSHSRLLGAYDHFYDDCVFGDNISTHYVALGHECILDISLEELPNDQHNHYRWFTREEMLSRDDVHKHSRWYIESNESC